MSRRSVLIVAPYLPWPADFGGALRIYHLIRELSREHDVMLLAPATRQEWPMAAALGALCDMTLVPASWTTRQPAGFRKRASQIGALASGDSFLERSARVTDLQPAIDRLFLTRKIDLVQFEFSHMGVFATPRPCPRVIDVHNIEHEALQRIARTSTSDSRQIFNTIEFRRVRSLERRVWSGATLCTATSTRDAHTVEEMSRTAAMVVPNGVETAYFSSFARRAADPCIVFTGAMRHAPNADGARWYLDRVHPMVTQLAPHARVAIVGADPSADLRARQSACVEVTGRVDDIRPWLASAAVAIVPLLAGGGTRLKILEAMAAGIPVVSTTVGAEGLDLVDGLDLLVADSPRAFADAILRVLQDSTLATMLSDRGKVITQTRFDWRVVVERLITAHDEAIRRFHAGR